MAGRPLHHQPSLVLMAGWPLHHQPSLVLMAGRSLHHQPSLVLMAGQLLHHQPSLVLMAGRPLQYQPPLVLIAERPLLLHFPIHPQSSVLGRQPLMVARLQQSVINPSYYNDVFIIIILESFCERKFMLNIIADENLV
jgi:hypothetical protein